MIKTLTRIALILISCALSIGPSATPPENDTRSYTLTVAGIEAALSTISLTQQGNEWQVNRRSDPQGLIANMLSDTVEESSRFRVEDGTIQPLSYTIDKGEGKQTATVNGDQVAFPNGKTGSTAGFDYAVDIGSLPYIFTVIDPETSVGKSLGVISDRRVAAYRIDDFALETLQMGSRGAVKTLRVRATSTDRENRHTTLWLDPSDMMPLQIDQYNKRSFLLTLVDEG